MGIDKARKRAKRKKNAAARNHGGSGSSLSNPTLLSAASASQLDVLLRATSVSNPNPAKAGVYRETHRILVVGDGDCSFCLSLATSMGARNRLVCTTYDSRGELLSKYSQSAVILKQLANLNVTVHHSVDCQLLHTDERINTAKYDRIVFNFPHVGGAKAEDVEMNKNILAEFFLSCAHILNGTTAEVHVTLRDTPFYQSWKLQQLANLAGLHLKKTEPFQIASYPGYEPQRTHPAAREAPPTSGAKRHRFCLTANRARGKLITGQKRTAESQEVDDEETTGERPSTRKDRVRGTRRGRAQIDRSSRGGRTRGQDDSRGGSTRDRGADRRGGRGSGNRGGSRGGGSRGSSRGGARGRGRGGRGRGGRGGRR